MGVGAGGEAKFVTAPGPGCALESAGELCKQLSLISLIWVLIHSIRFMCSGVDVVETPPKSGANSAAWLRETGLACKACGAGIFIFVLTGPRQGFQLERWDREGFHHQICFGGIKRKQVALVQTLR